MHPEPKTATERRRQNETERQNQMDDLTTTKKAEIMNECASNETKRKTYPWHKAIYLSSLFDQILVSGWVRCVCVRVHWLTHKYT